MQTLFWSLLNISAEYHQKSIHIISSYTVSKLGRFLRHSVDRIVKFSPYGSPILHVPVGVSFIQKF